MLLRPVRWIGKVNWCRSDGICERIPRYAGCLAGFCRQWFYRQLEAMVIFVEIVRGHLRTLVASNQELAALFRRHSIWLSELVVNTHIFSTVEG